VPCIAIGGGVTAEGVLALAGVKAIAVSIAERPQTIEEAMADGIEPVQRAGERIARLVGMMAG
jgi:glycerate kinase